MGLYYTVRAVVGYQFPLEEVLGPFVVRTPEESHLEPRYDPKTGAPVDPVKIIDRHSYVDYVIAGTPYDSPFVALDRLAEILNCDYGLSGGLNDNIKDMSVVFTPFRSNPDLAEAHGRITIHKDVLVLDGNVMSACQVLAKKLTELGLKPSYVVVTTCCHWG
jgi:hypothetical protein